MDSLDLYLARRKETQNWLLTTLAASLAIAVAARVPLVIVSLPLTWISGGFSIAFLWVAGPPALWFLQAMAFNAQYEADRARRLGANALRRPSDKSSGIVGAAATASTELQPLLTKASPFGIILLHGVLWLAPVVVNIVLLGSYLQFVRPTVAHTSTFTSRAVQEADAFLGIGGWGWFKPMAPSLQDNLSDLVKRSKNNDTREKYEILVNEIPYVFFPVQTWLYFAGIVFGLDVGSRALQQEAGIDPPRTLIGLMALARNRLKNWRAGDH